MRQRALVTSVFARLAGLLRRAGRDPDQVATLLATLVTLALRGCAAASIFALSVVVARRLGAEGVGIFSLGMTIMAIIAIFSSFSLDLSALPTIAVLKEKGNLAGARGWMRTAGLLTLLSGAVMIALAWAFSDTAAKLLNGDARLAFAIAVFSGAALAVNLARLYSAALRGVGRNAAASLVDPFLTPFLAVLAVLALQLDGLNGIIWSYVLAGVLAALAGWVDWLRHLGAGGRPAEPAPMLATMRQGLPYFGAQLGGFTIVWAAPIMLSLYSTLVEVAYYRVAAQFAMILAMVSQATAATMSARFAALHARGALRDIAPIARKMSVFAIVTGVLPGLLLMLVAEPALLIFGPEFVQAAAALRILLFGQIVMLLAGPVTGLLINTGLERYTFQSSIAGAALMIGLSWLLIPGYGVVGAAIATVVTTTAQTLAATAVAWFARGIFLPLGLVRQTSRPEE